MSGRRKKWRRSIESQPFHSPLLNVRNTSPDRLKSSFTVYKYDRSSFVQQRTLRQEEDAEEQSWDSLTTRTAETFQAEGGGKTYFTTTTHLSSNSSEEEERRSSLPHRPMRTRLSCTTPHTLCHTRVCVHRHAELSDCSTDRRP